MGKRSYCKFWIYWLGVNTKFTSCKFFIYTHPVNSKFTIWQKLWILWSTGGGQNTYLWHTSFGVRAPLWSDNILINDRGLLSYFSLQWINKSFVFESISLWWCSEAVTHWQTTDFGAHMFRHSPRSQWRQHFPFCSPSHTLHWL